MDAMSMKHQQLAIETENFVLTTISSSAHLQD